MGPGYRPMSHWVITEADDDLVDAGMPPVGGEPNG
jgi:hypothetical protein